jgi:hypothetical protein
MVMCRTTHPGRLDSVMSMCTTMRKTQLPTGTLPGEKAGLGAPGLEGGETSDVFSTLL